MNALTLRELVNKCNVDALLLTSYSNCSYYAKYMNPECSILATKNEVWYFTDDRYLEEARKIVPADYKLVSCRNTDYKKIYETVDFGSIKTIGIDDVKFADYLAMRNTFYGVDIFDFQAAISAPRAVKTEEEIALIAKAAHCNDVAFENLLGQVKEGMTELELAYLLQYEYIKAGGEGIAFDTISVFGEHTAYPHGHPGHTKLKYGDCVTLDFGTKYGGYCSDITRNFCFGKPDPEYVRCYQAVLEANKAGIDAVEVGKACKDVDKVARDVLKKYDLDKYFTHSLGHGVGIDIHEFPYLSPKSNDVFKENQVYTVEPGIYINGKFGIRIEDLLTVKNGRSNLLSRCNKELIIL
ncbi:MAG: aminopeptidase P family protein [Clostridia bacterium]|nr:aminopeptidase P family protein [Clostridia bacterium]